MDVLYRPAYSEVPKKTLDFNLEGLAKVVNQDIWSDPVSETLWKEAYPGFEYQLWGSLPSESPCRSQPSLHGVSIPCPNIECGAPVHSLAPQLGLFLTEPEECIYCKACEVSFQTSDVFFANLRHDWGIVQSQSNKDALFAIKGTAVDGNELPEYLELIGEWVRNWAIQCLGDIVVETEPLSSVDVAVKRLKSHGGLYHFEHLFELQRSIPGAYKSSIWPTFSVWLVAGLFEHLRSTDQEIINANWDMDDRALSSALERYLQHSFLRGKGWEMYLYPDTRFVRDAHRLLPSSYHRWCEDHIGQRLVAGPGSPIDCAHQTDEIRNRTSVLWQEVFSEPYTPLCSAILLAATT